MTHSGLLFTVEQINCYTEAVTTAGTQMKINQSHAAQSVTVPSEQVDVRRAL